tara:strand:+ start:119 stop:352 length:234 start_codon:yes stop_codon:yes gene_type:complete
LIDKNKGPLARLISPSKYLLLILEGNSNLSADKRLKLLENFRLEDPRFKDPASKKSHSLHSHKKRPNRNNCNSKKES